MALKNLLKSILNVKYIKILNTTINENDSSLHVYVQPTKGKMRCCPICGKNVLDMTPLL